MGRKKQNEQFTLLLGLIGIACGGYVISLALYLVEPFWRKGDSMNETIMYIVMAVVLIVCFLLWKRQDKTDKRIEYPQVHQEGNGLYKLIRDVHKGAKKDIDDIYKKSDLSARLKAGRAKLRKRKGESHGRQEK